jgi:hypothetical protein
MGLLCWLLSKPDNWQVSIAGCETQLQESKNTINRIIKELVDAGFAQKKRRSTGHVDWIISEKPYPNNRDMEKPYPKKPYPNICAQVNTDSEVNTDISVGARRIQKDWRPNETSVAWLQGYGVTIEQAAPVIAEFIAYWLERTTRRKDWNRSFRQNGPVQAALLRIKKADGYEKSTRVPKPETRNQLHARVNAKLAAESIAATLGAGDQREDARTLRQLVDECDRRERERDSAVDERMGGGVIDLFGRANQTRA